LDVLHLTPRYDSRPRYLSVLSLTCPLQRSF
jgi:hypothetical protein